MLEEEKEEHAPTSKAKTTSAAQCCRIFSSSKSSILASVNMVGASVICIISTIEIGIRYTNQTVESGKVTHRKSTIISIFNCRFRFAGVFVCVVVHPVKKHSKASKRQMELVACTGREHKYTVPKLMHCWMDSNTSES